MSQNLKMVRGDTYKFDATIYLNGVAVDLTGGVVRMTAKWSVSNPDNQAVFQLSSNTTGIVIPSPASGAFTATISPSMTSNLPARTVELPYDIQFVDALSNVYTVLYGTLTVVPDVTITT